MSQTACLSLALALKEFLVSWGKLTSNQLIMANCIKYYDGGGEVVWEYTQGARIQNLKG